MGHPSADPPSADRLQNRLAFLLLVLALAWHVQAATRQWESGALPGNSFRQTQTAHTTRFIARDRDYSLDYPTPLFGRPWSIPMEFPLYQWTVAALANHTDLSLVTAARTVSLACFYLTLPAGWILLAFVGLRPAHRALALVPAVLSPVTVFYSRAFLIETMALMFAVWFAAAFTGLMRRRHWFWLVATAVFGALSGLTKATTLLAAVLPCAVLGLQHLAVAIRTARRAGNWADVQRLCQWGLGAALLPFAATWWWTRFADEVKSKNPIGRFLTSENLAGFNFGSGTNRFEADLWGRLLQHWDHTVAPPLAIGLLLLAALVGTHRLRSAAWACLGIFVAVQMVFPVLYSVHDYYFIAIAGVMGTGLGLAALALADRTRFAWLAPGLILLVGLLQIQGYDRIYRPQIEHGGTGNDLTNTLFQVTEDDEVIVVVGDDWNSSIPYFAERRSLMLPRGQEENYDLIADAFDRLEEGEAAALVLLRQHQDNSRLIALAAEKLAMRDDPFFQRQWCTIYLARHVWDELLPGETEENAGSGPVPVFTDTMTNRTVVTDSLSHRRQRLFDQMTPMPNRFNFEFGPAILTAPGGNLINAHATTRLWFAPRSDSDVFEVEYGMFDSVWQNKEMNTDGVEMTVTRLSVDGAREVLFQRLLDPRSRNEDRGLQVLRLELDLSPGDELELSSTPGPHGQKNFDWFYLRNVRID